VFPVIQSVLLWWTSPTKLPLEGDAGKARKLDPACCCAMMLTIDLLEHPEHVFQVAVVQKPDRGVLVILLKWNWTCNTPGNKQCRKC
jgi:hypothetical protein